MDSAGFEGSTLPVHLIYSPFVLAGLRVRTKLIHRWTQRLSVAIHISTMEAVWARAQLVITAQGEWKGKEALTGVELRFSGARGRQ